MIQTSDENRQPLMEGTGFFINSNQVVTNSHVIKGAAYAGIVDLYGNDYGVESVVMDDPSQDLAILHTRKIAKAFLKFGDSQHLLEGQNVLVIGNPEGLVGTVSTGIISAIRRDNKFQFAAPISHGSSGSPVVDENGDVIGVASSAFVDGQNLNFAIMAYLIQGSKPNDPIVDSSPNNQFVQTEEDKVATLVMNYMQVTQNGKALLVYLLMSLSYYVTGMEIKMYL